METPGAPPTYFTGRGPTDFVGSEILVKRDFFWVYERRGEFFGSRKKRRVFLGGVLFIISKQQ